MLKNIVLSFMIVSVVCPSVFASEVLDKTRTQVVVLENAKTGTELVGIAPESGAGSRYQFLKNPVQVSRPDYLMLDPTKKSSDFNYDGPYSSRKKVYIFAGTVATAGLLAGTLTPVAATAGGATGGVGALAGAGVAVAGAPLATAYIRSRPDPHENDFEHKAQTVLIRDYQAEKVLNE